MQRTTAALQTGDRDRVGPPIHECLPQGLQVGDDVGDLLIGESAKRRADGAARDRIALTEAERRHQRYRASSGARS